MSHLRPEERAGRHKRSACRKGRHLWGEAQNVGAGIQRRICATCGELTIDLTGVHDPVTPVIRATGKIGTHRND